MKGKPKYEELLARISTLEIECEQHPSCYQLFQLLTDNSPDFFWAKDLEGRYLFANRAMCEKPLLAEDTDEAIGKADIFFADRARRQYPERDDWHTFGELCIDSDQVVINNKQAMRFDEYGNVNGKFLYLDVYKAPLFDDQGDMVGTVGSGRIVTREKAMEKKLRRSEEQFRSLADISPDLIYRLDSQGTVIYCSPSVVDLFGYEVDEVLGKKFQSFIYSDDMEQAEMFFHDFFAGSPRQEIELRLQNKSGDTIWTEINVASFPEHREPFGMQGIIRDISKRKQIEAQVFRSKQEWERTFDAVPDLIMILDPEHRIVKVNRAMADALDLDPAQCIGRFCYREIHNGSAPIEGCPQSRSVNDGKSHKTETWIEKFNGFFQISVSPIRDAGGNLIGSVHVMHDVTRLKKTEDVMQNLVDTLEHRVEDRTLEQQKTLTDLEQIFHAALPLVVLSIDFVVQRVNKAFCRYVGGRESQLVGRRCYELYQEERCNTDECTMRLLQSGVPEVIRYMDEILPNGRRLTCSIHSVPYRDVHGNLLGQISSLFDLSERRKAEDDLEKTRRQLLHAEKLHAVGSLSASIAHEFNNPLCGVINVLGRISRKGNLPEGDRTMLGLALNECERMKRLILDLQNFNRPTSGKTIYFDLHRAIDDILLMAKKELAVHNVLVSKEYAGITVVQCGIEDQIRQVILNLVKNSIDAMEGGGTISISTSVQEDAITIAIQDTGRGITPEAMEHIFEPFFTTKEAVKGSGLGLSVSYGIIKSHGGDISVSSQPGKGTTFTVSLPAYKKNNGTNP